MGMLNIAICDDDIQTTGQIERLIQKIAKRNFVDTDIEVFWNGESLVNTDVYKRQMKEFLVRLI